VLLVPLILSGVPAPATAQTALAEGTPHRLTVQPGTPVTFRLEPAAAFVDATVTFDGVEVMATLRHGATALVTARLPERTRGRMTVAAGIPADGDRGGQTPRPTGAAPLTLTVEVFRDYVRPAQVEVQWSSRAPGAADHERAALQREIYMAIGQWWDGSREAREAAATRLTGHLDRIRAVQSPAMLFDALIVLGGMQVDLNNHDAALAAIAEAGAIARASGDAANEATVLVKSALARGQAGEPEAAAELAKQAHAMRQRLDDGRGEAEALLTRAGFLTSRGTTAEALATLDLAEPVIEKAGDRRLQGTLFNQRGVIYYQTGRPREAREAYERALALRRQIGDRLGTGQTLSNLGVLTRDNGDVRRAIALMEEALALRRAAGYPQGVANTLYNLGNAHLDLSEFQRAIDLFTESLAIWRATNGARGEAFTLQGLGQAAARLGDPVKARVHYEQALALWQRVGDRRGEAIVLNYLAENAMGRDALDEAAALVEKSLISSRAANARREQEDALIVSGQLLRRRRDLAGSEARLREAIEIADAIKSRIGAANARMELGLTLEAAGRFAEARTAIEMALAAREEIGDRRGQVAGLAGLARLDRQAGALAEAQARVMRALDLVEQLRVGLLSTRARMTLGVTAQGVYELARDILIDRHLREPHAGHDQAALAVQERARARSLLEALTNGGTAVPAGDDVSLTLAARQRSLEADLEVKTARLGRLVDAGQSAEAVAAARAELSAQVLALDEVKAGIRKRSPAYAALTQIAPPPLLTAEAWHALLDDDTALVEIALGEDRSVGWLMTSKGLRTVVLPARAPIEASARALVASMTARNLFPDGEPRAARQARIAAADRRWAREASHLASLVLAPFGTLSARRIAFVADGALAGVPFAALPVTSRTGTLDLSRPCRLTAAACALGGHADVIALPSASILAELRHRADVARGAGPAVRALVLADPVFRADDPRVVSARRAGESTAASAPACASCAGAADESAGRDAAERDASPRDAAPQSLHTLPRLPFSREEAETIATLAGRDRVMLGLDFEASRARLTTPEVEAPDVLHIATHAVIDETQPELSGIVLSLVDTHGQAIRGFLPLVEVYDLPVHAQLVVLSACRTAAGADVPGEGLASLTRGFMYAGSPRVVASLWSVEDRATAMFMRAFYEALFVRGQRAPAALRTAQAALRRSPRWASPYYWAAFTFHGDWR
jgi:tetratricopeptide (TPR) repeat protein